MDLVSSANLRVPTSPRTWYPLRVRGTISTQQRGGGAVSALMRDQART